jgi:hypothetical protein
LDTIADLVDLYSEVEKLYPNAGESRLAKRFAEKLEELYFQILDFQARAACSFDKNTATRILINTLKIEDWGGKLEVVQEADRKCRAFANEYHWFEQKTGMEVINDLVQKQAETMKQVLSEIKTQSDRNKKVILWVSNVDVEAEHDRIRGKLGNRYRNSGQWLRSRYQAWLASSDTHALWLYGSGLWQNL